MIELRTQLCEDGRPPLTTVSMWDETHDAYYHDAAYAHALLQAVEEFSTQKANILLDAGKANRSMCEIFADWIKTRAAEILEQWKGK